MRKRFLLGLVAITGALTVVGSGFAAWYFDASIKDVTNKIGTTVTPLADSIGTLTDNNTSDTISIVLDQGGYANKSDATKGISIVKGDDKAEVSTLSATYKIEVDDAKNLVAAGITSGTFTVTYTLSTTAANYIEFASKKVKFGETDVDPSSSTDNSFTCSINVVFSTVTSSTYSLTASVDTSTTDGANALLKYKAKPSSKESYNSMSSALNNSTDALTVNYSFAANTTAN